jgi:hypothetical protein
MTDLSFLEGHDPDGLAELATAGIGEGDFDDDHSVPADVLELHEIFEWENAVAVAEGRDLLHPQVGVPSSTPGVERSTPFHTRADWGARPPKSRTAIPDPEGDTVHYGGPSPWPDSVDRSTAARFMASADHGRCASIVRAYQDFHMDDRGWSDIAYNSLACPHGHRYEGRGPGIRSAAQGTTDGNNRSYATCYIGGEGDPVGDPTKFAFLDEGTPNRMLRLRWGHRDWKSTACPGARLYAWRQAGFPAPETEDDMFENDDRQLLRRILTLLRDGKDENGRPINVNGLLLALDRAFTQDRGDDDVRTAIADQLINIGLERSAQFKQLKDDVAAILEAVKPVR